MVVAGAGAVSTRQLIASPPAVAGAPGLSERRQATCRALIAALALSPLSAVDGAREDAAVAEIAERYLAAPARTRTGIESALDAVEGAAPRASFGAMSPQRRLELLRLAVNETEPCPEGPALSQAFLVQQAVALASAPFIAPDVHPDPSPLTI